jgi:polysaccharide export outer membrane protein
LRVQKNIPEKFFGLLSFKSNFKLLFIFNFLISIFIFDISKADTNFPNKKNNQIEIEYLESRNELEDYIIDTGDSIYLEFFPAVELSGVFPVNEEGELLLPRLEETFVRGLTKSELKTLLEKRYAEFLIDPEIKVRIVVFKDIRVLARGELRNPGFYKFSAYQLDPSITSKKIDNYELDSLEENYNEQSNIGQNMQLNNQSSQGLEVKRSSENITTISDVIRKAGGITSETDLSRIEITRDVPLGKGGGKKRGIIDFNAYLNELDATNDIRIFDGDSLFFPKLSKSNPNQIPKSILSGISPKFISVNLFGRVETPGVVKLPLEATLSDAIDLSGPIKPLSGKIVLIRYEKDGKVKKKKISYSANAKRGSKRNPFLKEDDLITVKDSILGKTTGVIKEVTAPFVGIYSTKNLIEGFKD